MFFYGPQIWKGIHPMLDSFLGKILIFKGGGVPHQIRTVEFDDSPLMLSTNFVFFLGWILVNIQRTQQEYVKFVCRSSEITTYPSQHPKQCISLPNHLIDSLT